jgi:prepilin-type processing-associated H-X9-DG protein
MSNLHQIALGLAGYMVDHNQNTPPYVEYVNPDLYPAEDYSLHAPIDRHLGRFNAMFLDSHVESVTEESHHNPRFFVRGSGS